MHKPKIKKILFTLQKKFEPLKKKKFFLIRETTCSLLKYLFFMGAKKKRIHIEILNLLLIVFLKTLNQE